MVHVTSNTDSTHVAGNTAGNLLVNLSTPHGHVLRKKLVIVGLLIFGFNGRCALGEVTDAPIFVNIGNAEIATKYALTNAYKISKEPVCSSNDSNCLPLSLASILRKMHQFENEETTALRTYVNSIPSGAKWIRISPDQRFIAFGDENIEFYPRHSVTIQDVNSTKEVNQITINDSNMPCIKWLKDSSAIVILAEKSHLKLSPASLLMALAGHGAHISKYRLNILSTNPTVKTIELPVGEPVEDSVGCFE